jgi:iron-sulfur cluster assembly accessory protein
MLVVSGTYILYNTVFEPFVYSSLTSLGEELSLNSIRNMLTRSISRRLSLQLRPSAISRLEYLNKSRPESVALRVQVEAGGCSGFQYKLNLVPLGNQTAEDAVIDQGVAKVFVDKTSSQFLEEAEIEFKEEMVRSAFVVVANKVADSKCGCGASFNVGF